MNSRVLVIIAALVASGLTWWVEGIRWDADVSKLIESHTAALKKQSDQAMIDLTNQQKRTEAAQTALAALDAKYMKELADAISESDRLRVDIESGTKRLQLNATCKRMSKASGTASVDDDDSPRLTDSAQRHYLNLKERVGTATKQIAGLQDYIRQQCIKD